MDRTHFKPEALGKLEVTTFTERIWRDDHWEAQETSGIGFVPNPLPPALPWGDLLSDLYPLVLDAERSLSLLEGTARRLKNPHLLIGVFSRREAIQSSAIEDTFASAEDMEVFAQAPSVVEDRDAVREVRNYVRALEHGLSSPLPVCLRLIRELHAVLMEGVKKPGVPGVQPGEFRTTQNAIGKTSGFAQARFVPPPPRFLRGCLEDFEQYVNQQDMVVPRLVRFALIHYQFETIHPFADGNGRIGRLLITLMLCKQAQLSKPLVYVSGYFEQNRQDYYDLLYRVSTEGAWRPWIEFFLRAVATQARDAVERADRLLDLRESLLKRVQRKRASALLPPLVEHLFSSPSVTAAGISKLFKCTPNAAWALIRRLVEAKILVEYTGRERGQVFVAPDIINLIKD